MITRNVLFGVLALVLSAAPAWAQFSGGRGSGLPDGGNVNDCVLNTAPGAGSWQPCPSGGAPVSSTYIVQTADATLSAEQALGALATGLVLNTTTTGVLSIYGGVTCTNQVLRVLNASGGGTCNTITSAFVDSSILVSGGALGTPSSGVATNLTGTAAGLTAGAATALAANGANCAAGNYPLGVDASGAAESCTAAGAGTVTVVGAGSLTSTALVTGGGTQTIQTPAATATMDTSGNISTPGSISSGVGGTVAGALQITQGTAPAAGTTAITLHAPTAVTSYTLVLPGTSTTGFMLGTDAANINTVSRVGSTGTGNVVRDTSPTLVTPALGTPTSGVMTNVTGTASGLTAGAATALAANPTDCAANQFANAIAASGNLTCGAIADADVPDTITVSNYLPLAGGTLTGQLVTDNLGIEFDESDINPTCAAGNFSIYADLSENKLKKCTNGSATDLDTTGGTPSFDTITGGTNTTAAMVVGTGGSLTTSGSGSITASAVAADSVALATGTTGAYVAAITGGTGITSSGGGAENATVTLTTDSTEQGFIAAGALTCGAATNGKMQVHTTPLQYCDNAVTPALQYAAYADSSGNALAGDTATAFFSAGTLEVARGGTGIGAFGTGVATGLGNNTNGAGGFTTTDGTKTLTGTTLDAEGTGNVVTIPKRIWLPAAGCNNATAGPIWDLPATSPAVAACITGTNTQKGVLDFADAANLSAQITHKLPSTWAGTVDANIKWLSATTTGDVVWQLSTICVADAETDDPAFNTASTVTDTTKGTTNQTNDASITTVTVTGCAASELMHVKIQRDSAHASDTMAGTARLIGVELVVREAI